MFQRGAKCTAGQTASWNLPLAQRGSESDLETTRTEQRPLGEVQTLTRNHPLPKPTSCLTCSMPCHPPETPGPSPQSLCFLFFTQTHMYTHPCILTHTYTNAQTRARAHTHAQSSHYSLGLGRKQLTAAKLLLVILLSCLPGC